MSLKIIPLKSDELHPLYCRYDGQQNPQNAFVQLDTREGTLSADYTGEIDGIPFGEYYGYLRRYDVSQHLNAEEIQKLLRYLAPIAQRVLDGVTEHTDQNMNPDIRLSEAAEKAEEEIEKECEMWTEYSVATSYDQGVWPADHYYNSISHAEIGLTPQTTDAQLDKIIEEEIDTARCDGVTIDGVEKYLTDELETLRAEQDHN